MNAVTDIIKIASSARPNANSITISETAGDCSINCICNINTDTVSDINPISNVTMTSNVICDSVIFGSSNSGNTIY